MVTVTRSIPGNEDELLEEMYILGGIRVGSFEQKIESKEVNKLNELTQQWVSVGELLQPRAAHRSWVSYGLQLDNPEGTPG